MELVLLYKGYQSSASRSRIEFSHPGRRTSYSYSRGSYPTPQPCSFHKVCHVWESSDWCGLFHADEKNSCERALTNYCWHSTRNRLKMSNVVEHERNPTKVNLGGSKTNEFEVPLLSKSHFHIPNRNPSTNDFPAKTTPSDSQDQNLIRIFSE